MEQKSMTAPVSAFSRAYHSKVNTIKIFDDFLAERLIGEEKYNEIAESMKAGIAFFNPDFRGTGEQALRWIVDNQLSPSPLAREAFAESALRTAVGCGTRQYVILGAGYDTFAYRGTDFGKMTEIFEVDLPATAENKKDRLKGAGIEIPDNVSYVCADLTCDFDREIEKNKKFSRDKVTFCSLLGVLYYIEQADFEHILKRLTEMLREGSSLVFDYPGNIGESGERDRRQSALADGAGERMKSGYGEKEMEKLLEKYGFLMYEHLDAKQMTEKYFAKYNAANPDRKITAFENVSYCLAVKKG